MMNINPYPCLLLLSILLLSTNLCPISAASHVGETFIQCLTQYSQNHSNSLSNIICTPNNPSFQSILQSSIQNLRFKSPANHKPNVIVTPLHESQIPPVIHCAKKHGMEIRIRSGGHDFEGLSSVCRVPFCILDFTNLRSVDVDVNTSTAWVQSGATLAEVYYRIAEKSNTLGFPAGFYPTVGVGGIISGGGYGTMKRKYGLAADNVIDARIVDVNGRILDRKSMGEDLFWAIRGGGGSSFGVILSYKLNLVAVPKTVTIFTVGRNLEQNATDLVLRWQSIAHKLPKSVYLRVQMGSLKKGSISVEFVCLFLGKAERLVTIMNKRFPELGLTKEDCKETNWIGSVMFFAHFRHDEPLEILLNRTALPKSYNKGKSDYVKQPISKQGLEGLWEMFYKIEPGMAAIVMSPYGGKMSEISDDATPYPHRAGNLYSMLQSVHWDGENATVAQRYITWIRSLSDYLTPYVSKNPREAYVNYNDLDLGVNTNNNADSKKWGYRYFKNNFERLVKVKGMVDPDNFFRHEQSIPPSLSSKM